MIPLALPMSPMRGRARETSVGFVMATGLTRGASNACKGADYAN